MTPANIYQGSALPYFTPDQPYFEPIINLCRARLAALQPERIAAACRALEYDVVALGVTGRESDAVVAAALKAAVAAAAGPDAPWEVTTMLQARAVIQHGNLLLGGVGERLGQTGDASRHVLVQRARQSAEGGMQPPWGAAQLHMVFAAARYSAVRDAPQRVAEAERVLQAVMKRIATALEQQQQVVAGLSEHTGGDGR